MYLYELYMKERMGMDVIQGDHGFIVYAINKQANEAFVQELFIREEYRKQNLGSKLVDKVYEKAKEAGVKYLTATVIPSTNNAHVILLAALKYGCKILRSSENCIVLFKEVT